MSNKIMIGGRDYEGDSAETDSMETQFKVKSLELVEIDCVLASAIKVEATMPMPGQRPLDRKTVDEYMRLMNKGLWHLSTIHIVEVVRADGTPEINPVMPDRPLCYLINGNHTLQAVIDSQKPIFALVSIFEATRDKMHLLFSQIDNHRVRRSETAMDPIAKTFGQRSGRSNKNVLPPKTLDTIVTAVHWANFSSFDSRPKPPRRDVAITEAASLRPFLRWLIGLHEDPSNPFLKDRDETSASYIWKVPIIAAMWKCWRISEHDATRFWGELLKGSTQESAVMKKLHNILISTKKASSWGKEPYLRILKLCSIAWCAWLNKTPLEISGVEDIAAMPEESVRVILFGNDAVGIDIERPENSTMKTGSIDRRGSIEEDSEGNEEEHHITVGSEESQE